MPTKLKDTLEKVRKLDKANSDLLIEFYEYLRAVRTSERYQSDILKVLVKLSEFETSNFEDDSIPSNIIDDIMRKHQQFAYTLGSPSSDIEPTIDSKGYYQKFYNGYIFWHPQFGANEVHGGISDKWGQLDRESGALGYPISDNMILMEVVKATLKKVT